MTSKSTTWAALAAALMGPGMALAQPVPAPLAPAAAPAADVVVRIHTDQGRRTISPLIYGVNLQYGAHNADFASPRFKHFSFQRNGGNRMSAYNWTNNASNAGSDYHDQNDNFLDVSNAPGHAVFATTQAALDAGAFVLLTVPMTGYVAADKGGDGDVNKTPGYLQKRFVPSFPRKAAPFSATPDPNAGAVYQDEWVAAVKAQFPKAFAGDTSRIFFSLDNEPDLWATTHPRIRGGAQGDGVKLTYAELFARSDAYASAIKDVAPNTLVFGAANYGWGGFKDLRGAPDAHDALYAGQDFLDAYLTHMRQSEAIYGKRLLDVLDIHWYPEDRAGGVRINVDNDDSPAVARARMEAPRSLWDKSFVEPSWIGQSTGAVALIPRLMDKIDRLYPDTLLSISEYYYGGRAHISGGVTEAEALGVFGQQGLFAAALWPPYKNYDFILGGFDLYTNFDGKGGHFGEVSVATETSDAAETSAYASVDDGGDPHMVTVLVNRSDKPLRTAVQVWSDKAFASAHLYRLAGTNPAPQDAGQVAVTGDVAVITLPPVSATTVEFRP